MGVLFYADDGILYSDKPFVPSEILNFPIESGIKAHIDNEKSKWVKYDGNWKIPLKFAGKKFIPNILNPMNSNSPATLSQETFENSNDIQDGTIINSTKNIKNFIFDKARLFGIAVQFDKWYYELGVKPDSKNGKLSHKGGLAKSEEGETIDFGSGYEYRNLTEAWIESKYFNYIDSRIYLGSYEDLPVQPEWKEYKFIPGSWSHMEYISASSWPNTIIGSSDVGTEVALATPPNKGRVNLFTASSYATKYLADYIKNSKLNRTKFKGKTNIEKLR